MTISETSNRQFLYAQTTFLSFNIVIVIHHINKVICKASKMIGITYRTFRMLTPHTLHLLYISLVRPHLDYACVAWQP